MSSPENPKVLVSIRPTIVKDEGIELKDSPYKLCILYGGVEYSIDFGEGSVLVEFDPGVLVFEFVLSGNENEKKLRSHFDLSKYHSVIVESEVSYGPHSACFHLLDGSSLKYYFDLIFHNCGISIEEHCEKRPLFPLASKNFQYQPLLMNIFSYLPSSFLINRMRILNSYFHDILKKYVHRGLTFNKKSFYCLESKKPEDFVEEFSRTNEIARTYISRWNCFLRSVLSTRLMVKSLSIENETLDEPTIFTDFKVASSSIDGVPFDTDKHSNYDIDDLTLPLMDTLSFKPFEHLFCKLSKVSINHMDYIDLISLINNIPHLKEMNVIDLHFPLDSVIKNQRENIVCIVKENNVLEILQCGFVRTKDELNLFYLSVQNETEKFAVEVLTKCSNLKILELPYLPTERFDQNVYYSCKDFDESRLSLLDKFLRNKFLDSSGNYIPLLTSPDSPIDETFMLHLGTFTPEPVHWSGHGEVYSTERDKCLIVMGIPFRVFFQVTDQTVYAGISCPYVNFAAGLGGSPISHIDVDTRTETVRKDRQETKVVFGDVEADFGIVRETNGRRPLHFKWGRCVPFRIRISEFFKTEELFKRYLEVKNTELIQVENEWIQDAEEDQRDEDEVKVEKNGKEKRDQVYNEFFTLQRYEGKTGSCEVEIDVRKKDIIYGSCVAYFSLFEGLMDWRLEYCVSDRDDVKKMEFYYPRRNLFLCWKYNSEGTDKIIMVPGSFHIQITQIFYDEDEEKEEEEEGEEVEKQEKKKNYEEVKTEIFSPMCYYEEEVLTRFLFIMDQKNKRTEKKVKMKISFEVMDKVVGLQELETYRHNILKMNEKVPITEEKLLEINVRNSNVEENIGIVSANEKNEDPRRRVFTICGLDFYVSFTPFETKLSKNGTCGLHFQLSRRTSAMIRLHGKMTVKVLEDDLVISTLEKEMGEDDTEWEEIVCRDFNELCNVDQERENWRFLVRMELDRIEHVQKEKDEAEEVEEKKVENEEKVT